MKGTTDGSEIVQVEGGHILRSTGRKDRHSKVYTSKGPRDRRVRLSAHTAIQFYDVQDRLGYDRPSKAVDWLIKKAQTSIDKLNELPPAPDPNPISNERPLGQAHSHYPLIQPNNNPGCSNSSFVAAPAEPFFPTTNFPDFSNDDSVSNLGLCLHNFQGWNNGRDMDNRVGFLVTSPENAPAAAIFSHRELLQSNLTVNPWNHQRPLDSTDQHNPQPSDFGGSFELGFRIPARIYGDEEADDHR